MVVGGELQIQSLTTDRLSPWQTYVLVGCINETLLLSWFHNYVNFTSVIWCMCHSIMIIMYITISVLLEFVFVWFHIGFGWVRFIFVVVEISQKMSYIYIYSLLLVLFRWTNSKHMTWLKRPSNLHQVMPSNAGERSEGAGWSWICCCLFGKSTWIENRQNLSRNQGSEHVSTTRWCFMIWTFWCHVFHICLNNFAILDSLVDMLYVLLIDRDS